MCLVNYVIVLCHFHHSLATTFTFHVHQLKNNQLHHLPVMVVRQSIQSIQHKLGLVANIWSYGTHKGHHALQHSSQVVPSLEVTVGPAHVESHSLSPWHCTSKYYTIVSGRVLQLQCNTNGCHEPPHWIVDSISEMVHSG
jgi:hypothetical protein